MIETLISVVQWPDRYEAYVRGRGITAYGQTVEEAIERANRAVECRDSFNDLGRLRAAIKQIMEDREARQIEPAVDREFYDRIDAEAVHLQKELWSIFKPKDEPSLT